MSLRLQILRMKVRVKKSISNLRNKDKVNNILERVRQKKAQQMGLDISQEQLIPKESVTQRFKASLKAKIQQNRIVQRIKGFYSKYKDKYWTKEKREGLTEYTEPKTMPVTRKANINPALLKKISHKISDTIPNATNVINKNTPIAEASSKTLKNKLANLMMKKQKAQMDKLNKQTYCHDENKHHQNQNIQTP